jgi:ubiquinone/menaquinone biosynthesis C-methylase UbiE
MAFESSWGNSVRSVAYSKLEFPNTYYLAYRDLPAIIETHIKGNRAIDFGCGTGRSTRFLKQLGFEVTGIDISEDLLTHAREMDPGGEYIAMTNGQFSQLPSGNYDLIQSVFTFDNIPGWETRITILKSLRELLCNTGKIICLDSNSEMYTHEWASFTTKDFLENKSALTGDIVKIIMTDVDDRRPVEDILWTEEDYNTLFELAGFENEATYKPLGFVNEPYNWIVETNIAPWIIFVLKKNSSS